MAATEEDLPVAVGTTDGGGGKPKVVKKKSPTNNPKSKKASMRSLSPNKSAMGDTNERKVPVRSKSDEGPSLATAPSPSPCKPKKQVRSPAIEESTGTTTTTKKHSLSQTKLPSKARLNNSNKKSPTNAINAAGQLQNESRTTMIVPSKAAASAKKNLMIAPARPPPLRTRSNDSAQLGSGRKNNGGEQQQPPSLPRSRSSDLETMRASNVKDQRSGIPPRNHLLAKGSSHRCILKDSSFGKPRVNAGIVSQNSVLSDDDNDFADDDSDVETEDIKFNDDYDDNDDVDKSNKNNDKTNERQKRDISITKQASFRPGMNSRPGLPAGPTRPALTKSKRSLLDLSNHSFKSTLDLMSVVDGSELWPNDPLWKRILRYIRILPPYPQERMERKWIRIYTWSALLCDFIAALVSLVTYSGVSNCCGVPMFSLLFLNVNWTSIIQIITYIYMVLIFVEVLPVLRGGMPLNLLNPLVGALITFAVFFDERLVGAVIMWIIEACSVFFEFRTYRLHSRLYYGRYDKLDELEKSLASNRILRTESFRAKKPGDSRTSRKNLNDDLSLSIGSFEDDGDFDEIEEGRSTGITKSISGQSMSSSPSTGRSLTNVQTLVDGSGRSKNSNTTSLKSFSNHKRGRPSSKNLISTMSRSSSDLNSSSHNDHKYQESRLLRERRQLRLKQKEERKKLSMHLAGVIINTILACLSLILIIVIASSGGLCIRKGEETNIFSMDQLGTCNDCPGKIVNGVCEVCNADGPGDYQCYYQYL